MAKLPKRFLAFMETYPAIGKAYNDMSAAVAEAGPLDAKTCAFIKLGICIGNGLEGAAQSQTRKALEAGATPEEIRHAVLQATTTAGFPTMMRAMTWVEPLLTDQPS